MGVWFSVFLGLLVLIAWPFLGRDPEGQVLDVVAAVLVALLALCSTLGVRLAVHFVRRAIERDEERGGR
jgi:steroid 5-alpha reductase family enzyme